jgi:hypothetical protein
MFMASNIIENTTADARGLLWTCELIFNNPTRGPSEHQQPIRRRGREMPNSIGAQFDTVALCLVALERMCLITHHSRYMLCVQVSPLR